MKKLFITLLLMSIIVLSACGQNAQKTKNLTSSKGTSNTELQNKNTGKQDSGKATKQNVNLPDELKDSFRAICFDTPPWQLTDEGFGSMLNRADLLVVYEPLYKDDNITEKAATAVKVTDDIFAEAFKFFKSHTKTKFKGTIKGFKIEKNEAVSINGLNMTKFEGYIDTSNEQHTNRHSYMVGYSFIKDDTPAYITGIVMDESQSDALKKEIDDTVTAMINTLRDARK